MKNTTRPTKANPSAKARKPRKIISFYEYHRGPLPERIERRAVKPAAPPDPFARFRSPEAARRVFLVLRDFDAGANPAQWQCLSHILNGICVMLREQNPESTKTIAKQEV